MNDLDSKISDMCSRLANAEIGVDTEHLGDIVQNAYMQTVFDVTKGADYRAAFDLIPESRVKAILSTNWSGQMFSERVWDNTNALADGLKHDMLVGIMAGKSEQHMADDIMNRCGVGAFEARRLVRTETTCVANMAELYGYKELDIDEYEFSACLDNRTSDLCRELDGKVFKRNSAQAGVNLPPMHPFCRSTTLPVLPSEEDLDKELAELGDEIGTDVDFDEWERNLQQGEDGKWRYVAGSADKPMRFAGNGVDKSDESDIIEIRQLAQKNEFDYRDYEEVIDEESVDNLKKYVKEEMGISYIAGIDKLKNGHVAGEILSTIKSLSDKYGECFSRISLRYYGNERTAAETIGKELALNIEYMNRPGALQELLDIWNKKGFIPKGCNNSTYIAQHEYFHLLTQDLVDAPNSLIKKYVRRAYKNGYTPVSQNGLKNCHEEVADLLSAKILTKQQKQLKERIFKLLI